MRRLIINADDFGLTHGVNRAILRAHSEGVVTSATLMANSSAFADGVEIAKQRPQLSVGCHVMLVDGAALSQPAPQSLLNGNGRFRNGFGEMALAAFRNKLSPDEIEREALTQFGRLVSAGIQPTHFDTHKHTHMLPQALAPLLRASRATGILAVRNPFAPMRPLAFAHLIRRPRLWARYTEVGVLRRLAERFREQAAKHGLITTDGTFGIVVTGALDQRLFDAIIGNLPEGTWEFVCHPGYNDAELGEVRTRLRESREQELRVLTSPECKQALRAHGVELISYKELVQERASACS